MSRTTRTARIRLPAICSGVAGHLSGITDTTTLAVGAAVWNTSLRRNAPPVHSWIVAAALAISVLAPLPAEAQTQTARISLKLADSSIPENGGMTTVTASLDVATRKDVTLEISVSGGGEDATLSANRVLSIAAGQTESTGTVTITAVDNDKAEARDRIVVVSGRVTDGELAKPDDVVFTLVNDDESLAVVSLNLMPFEIEESSSGGNVSTTVTARLSKAVATDVTVEVSVEGEGEYAMLSANRVLSIATGQTMSTGEVTITAINDNVDAGGQRLVVSGTVTSSDLADPEGLMLRIVDDDTPGFAVSDTSALESEELIFTVTLTGPSDVAWTMTYQDAFEGNATEGIDYTLEMGRLVFEPGETSHTIAVNVIDDATIEPDETMRIRVLVDTSGPRVFANPLRAATGTILNDDSRFVVRPGEPNVIPDVNGQTVAVNASSGIPEGIEIELPSLLGEAVTLTLDPAVPVPPDPKEDAFRLGEVEADRTLVALSVTPALADGLEICLPVTPGLSQETGSTRRLRLLRFDRTDRTWLAVGSQRVERGLVCASGVMDYSFFAVGYVPPLLSDQEVTDWEHVLAGVARTLASDAVEVVGGRFDASPANGMQMTLAGHPLRSVPRDALAPDLWHRAPAYGDITGPGDPWHSQHTTSLSGHDLLTRSSFELALDDGEDGGSGSGLTVWGRGSASAFASSPDADFGVDGTFRSGWLGLDYRIRPSLLVGVAVTRGMGTVEHERKGGNEAEADATVTGLTPYVHLQAGPGLELWGLLGSGQGEMEITLDGGDPLTADLTSFMGGVGGRQALNIDWGGMDLAARADAFFSTLQSGETNELAGLSGEAQRIRLLAEGSSVTDNPDTRTVSRLMLGGRWDGGSGDSGAGVEVGGGLAWTQKATGVQVDLQGRYLLAHSANGYKDWGASLDLRFDPGADERGLMFSLSPVLGDAASGREHLYGATDLTGLAANDNRRANRVDSELAYGIAGFSGAGTVTPYGGLTLDGADTTRYRLGGRVALGSSLDLIAESIRTERAGRSPSHGLSAQLGLQW